MPIDVGASPPDDPPFANHRIGPLDMMPVTVSSPSPGRRRRLAGPLVAVLLVAGLLWPAASNAGELEIEIHGSGQHAYSPTFDALGRGDTPNVHFNGTLGAAWDLEDWVGFRGLSIYGAFSRGGTGNARFDGDYSFRWTRTLYLAGLEAGYDLGPYVRPFARVTAGAALQKMELEPPSEAQSTDRSLDVATRNSAGLELHTPLAPTDGDAPPLALGESVRLGVTLSAGYLWQARADFDELKPSGDDSNRWQPTGHDLGSLDASGWFWAVGANIRIGF